MVQKGLAYTKEIVHSHFEAKREELRQAREKEITEAQNELSERIQLELNKFAEDSILRDVIDKRLGDIVFGHTSSIRNNIEEVYKKPIHDLWEEESKFLSFVELSSKKEVAKNLLSAASKFSAS